jgi:hypothetical protein
LAFRRQQCSLAGHAAAFADIRHLRTSEEWHFQGNRIAGPVLQARLAMLCMLC